MPSYIIENLKDGNVVLPYPINRKLGPREKLQYNGPASTIEANIINKYNSIAIMEQKGMIRVTAAWNNTIDSDIQVPVRSLLSGSGPTGTSSYMPVADIAARNAIPMGDRVEGLLVRTNDSGLFWVLEADLLTWSGGIDPLSVDNPVSISASTNDPGVATTVARSDHIHAHGNLSGGSLHALAVAAGSAGFMSGSDKAKLDVSSHSYLQWGNNSISSTTTTRYLTPGYGDSTAQTTVTQQIVPTNGTLQNLRVKHNNMAGNGNSIVYTVRVNGVATSIVVTLASTASEGSDTTHTISVVAGDKVDIQLTKALSIGASPTDVTASLEVKA